MSIVICNKAIFICKICNKCNKVKSIVCVFRFYNREDKIRSKNKLKIRYYYMRYL